MPKYLQKPSAENIISAVFNGNRNLKQIHEAEGIFTDAGNKIYKILSHAEDEPDHQEILQTHMKKKKT